MCFSHKYVSPRLFTTGLSAVLSQYSEVLCLKCGLSELDSDVSNKNIYPCTQS